MNGAPPLLPMSTTMQVRDSTERTARRSGIGHVEGHAGRPRLKQHHKRRHGQSGGVEPKAKRTDQIPFHDRWVRQCLYNAAGPQKDTNPTGRSRHKDGWTVRRSWRRPQRQGRWKWKKRRRQHTRNKEEVPKIKLET